MKINHEKLTSKILLQQYAGKWIKEKNKKPVKKEIYTEAKKYVKKNKVTPIFESRSVEPKEVVKKKTLALPAHEQKIMDQVFGN